MWCEIFTFAQQHSRHVRQYVLNSNVKLTSHLHQKEVAERGTSTDNTIRKNPLRLLINLAEVLLTHTVLFFQNISGIFRPKPVLWQFLYVQSRHPLSTDLQLVFWLWHHNSLRNCFVFRKCHVLPMSSSLMH